MARIFATAAIWQRARWLRADGALKAQRRLAFLPPPPGLRAATRSADPRGADTDVVSIDLRSIEVVQCSIFINPITFEATGRARYSPCLKHVRERFFDFTFLTFQYTVFLNGQHLQQIRFRSRLSLFEVASTGTASRERISQALAVIVVAGK